MAKIRIAVVDHNEIYRVGLVDILRVNEDFEIVATFSTLLETLQRADEFDPDVIVFDTEFSRLECVSRTHDLILSRPQARIIALTHSEAMKDLVLSLSIGAHGFVSKEVSRDELARTVRSVHAGNIVISGPMGSQMSSLFAQLQVQPQPQAPARPVIAEPGEQPRPVALSPRETEILEYVAEGKKNREIAEALFISENTVKVHLRNIMEKMDVHSRYRAALLALQNPAPAEHS